MAGRLRRAQETLSGQLKIRPNEQTLGRVGGRLEELDTVQGYDRARIVDAPKSDPAKIAAAALDGIEAKAWEVLGDDLSRQVKSALSAELDALYPQLS
jgi:hypothetical protein